MLTKAKQFLVHRIAHIDRGFRDLAVNPVQTVLIRHGARFSSFNCFVKWPGEFGMGPNLGLHQDQGGVPVQSTQAVNANATWNLTKYRQTAVLRVHISPNNPTSRQTPRCRLRPTGIAHRIPRRHRTWRLPQANAGPAANTRDLLPTN